MIVLIDNYDSFSYNLYQLVGGVEPDVRVVRNDALSVAELAVLAPQAVLLSPGPGRPADAGICVETVRSLSGRVPILGVCLGHQAICEAFGGTVTYAKRLMHGKSSQVAVVGAGETAASDPVAPDASSAPPAFAGPSVPTAPSAPAASSALAAPSTSPAPSALFAGLEGGFTAARYHSLALDESTLPAELCVTARSVDDGEVMAVEHVAHPTFGLQFHPESIMTPQGRAIVENFMRIARAFERP